MIERSRKKEEKSERMRKRRVSDTKMILELISRFNQEPINKNDF